MRRLLSIVVAVVMFAFCTNAQSNFGVLGGATGGGVSAGSGSDVSDDLFSGSTVISIPLMAKSLDGMNLGVSLSYSTSGIKLNQISSCVGLGWNLNTGGVIFRNIKGIPDEYQDVNAGFKGYWHRTNANLIGNNPLSSAAGLDAIAGGGADGQMDEFTLILPGIHLNFYINTQNEIVTIPSNSRVQIKRTINGAPVSIFPMGTAIGEMGFEVIDEGGNTFKFEVGEKSEYSLSQTCQGLPTTHQFATAWVIDKIITSNNKEVDYGYLPYTTYTVNVDVAEEIVDIDPQSTSCYVYHDFTVVSRTNMIKYLNFIEFPDVKINLSYGNTRLDVPGTKVLNDVEIVEKSNHLSWPPNVPSIWNLTSKKIKLVHGYHGVLGMQPFQNPSSMGGSPLASGPSDLTKELRLSLDKVQLVAAVNTYRDLYKFDYYDVDYAAHPGDVQVNLAPGHEMTLPYRLNPCQDYWGYYTGNQTLGTGPVSAGYVASYIPNDNPASNYLDNVGINRNPTPKNVLFALKRITNQSRGVSEYEYGLNSVTHNGGNFITDGLRLDKVRRYTAGMEGNTTEYITEYVYENGEWLVPSNNLEINSLFKQTGITAICEYLPLTGPAITSTFWNHTKYSNHFFGQLLGAQHGYGKVTTIQKAKYNEKIGNGPVVNTIKQLGKSETFYSTLRTLPPYFQLPVTLFPNGSTSIMFPPLLPGAYSALSILPSQFMQPFNQVPYTYKQYYVEWLLGNPYRTKQYDQNNNLKSDVTSEYTVTVNRHDGDNWVNLNHEANSYKRQIAQGYGGIVPDCLGANQILDFYPIFSGRANVSKTTSVSYLNNSTPVTTVANYEYNAQTGYLEKTTETKPNNVEIENRQFYNSNNLVSANPEMSAMLAENRNAIVHTEVWRKEGLGQPFKLLNASGSGFALFNGKVRPKTSYLLKGYNLLASSPFTTGAFTIANANAGNAISGFEKSAVVTKYDDGGNACEATHNGRYTASIYDYYQDALVATVSNAKYSEVAYCSFESNQYSMDPDPGYFKQNKGNWLFNPSNIQTSRYMTGRRCYNLTQLIWVNNNAVAPEIITSEDVELEIGKKYVVSFWKLGMNETLSLENWFTYNGAAGPNLVSMNVPITTYTTNNSSIPALNSWVYCQAEFVAQHKRLKLSATVPNQAYSCLVDELRLYPADAAMNTSCFSSVYGKTTDCDAQNNIIRYEYDEAEQIHITRDIHGNILSKTKTAIQQQD